MFAENLGRLDSYTTVEELMAEVWQAPLGAAKEEILC